MVRFCTVPALEDAGVSPERLYTEVPIPALAGGKLDLTVEGRTEPSSSSSIRVHRGAESRRTR